MRRFVTKGSCWLLAVFSAALTAGCVAPVKGLFPPVPGARVETVYVIDHGLHTGLALPRADLAVTDPPVLPESPRADYLEFGWGDAAYYPAAHPTISMGLKALFWPSPSVVNVTGISGPLSNAYPAEEIIAVELSEAGFERLRDFVANSFRRDQQGNLIPAEAGFYEAKGKFYFLHTCNWWTAAALRAAGCPIATGGCVTAACVMAQTRKFGKVIH